MYGGTPIQADRDLLKSKDRCPHILVGTPGRINGLVREKALRGSTIKTFVLDECDKMLEAVGQSSLAFRLRSVRGRPSGSRWPAP